MKCEKCGSQHNGETIKVSEWEDKCLCQWCLVEYATLKYSTVNLKWWTR